MKNLLIITCLITFCLAIFAIVFLSTFKMPYKQKIDYYCNSFNVQPELVYSIIKAESKFNPNAVSKAGAKGLMQLMPSTAKYIAEVLNENFEEIDIFEVENNLKLGIKYISYLLSKFENVNLVICAYNAGESTVKNWVENKIFESDNYENIPYYETKDYLKKVNFNVKVYKILLKR